MFAKLIAWATRQPSKWSVIEKIAVNRGSDGKMIGVVFVMQDQYGNVKEKRVML